MTIQHNFSLKKYNTFGLDVQAQEFVAINTLPELTTVLKDNTTKKLLILGGGSNMLLTHNVEALVIHVNLKGKKVLKQNQTHVWVEVQAGENWHEFVMWAIDQNYGGLENMSLIPGNVGTTPVQNIGAYGAEIKDSMEHCTAINIKTQQLHTFTNAECRFGYRESIFKQEAKGEYIITSVVFKLTTSQHIISVDYGDIQKELLQQGIQNPTIKEVSNAVIAIRKSKLPDPNELGNSGSFFKNPILTKAQFNPILTKHPTIKYYEISADEVKIPAGWLIEQAGLKGYRLQDAGVHTKQALVLVNYGKATGQDILNLSHYVQQTIFDKYGIKIEAEVNII